MGDAAPEGDGLWVAPCSIRVGDEWATLMTRRAKSANAKRETTTPAKPYEPTPREREAAIKVAEAKAIAPCLKSKMKDGNAEVWFDHPDQDHGMALLMDTIGAQDPAFFEGLISQLGNASAEAGQLDAAKINFVLGVMKDIAPKDAVEAMLVAQMAVVQMATMTFACKLANAKNLPQQDSAERAFNKLARTYTTQMEAFKRYRTGGQQTVTVEHVTVNAGGQAIVGNVETGGRGSGKKRR